MKLSTRGRYGTRAMLDLALHYSENPVMLRDIAKRQEVSARYLEQIMTALVSANLVQSIRGKQGGFRLAKPPSEIRLSHILTVLEGSFSLVNCVENSSSCSRADICVPRDVWKGLKEIITDFLDSITLESLAHKQRRKMAKEGALMYYI